MLSGLGRPEAQKGVESDRGKDPGIHLKLLVSPPQTHGKSFTLGVWCGCKDDAAVQPSPKLKLSF